METTPTTQTTPPGAATPATPARLIDQTHAAGSATALAILAVDQYAKDYDGYLLHMLQQKIPGRQAELLYKKIATEKGILLSSEQKKGIAKGIFERHDLTTTIGVNLALDELLAKLDVSRGALKGWMKKYAKAKDITLAKASRTSGTSSKTEELFAFIISGHNANQPKDKIIQVTVDKFGLKESTVKSRYAAIARDQGWNLSADDKALRVFALANSATVTAAQLASSFPKASKTVLGQITHAVAFFQESLVVLNPPQAPE